MPELTVTLHRVPTRSRSSGQFARATSASLAALKERYIAVAKTIYSIVARNSLYHNSIFLMLATGVSAASGFVFWTLNARLLSPHEVGLAATLISALTLLSNLSQLGLNSAFIRYLPYTKRPTVQLNTVGSTVALAALLFSSVFLATLQLTSPSLVAVLQNPLFDVTFVLFSVIAAANTLGDSVLLAYRSARFVLRNSIVAGCFRIALPIALASQGTYGVFLAFSVPTALSVTSLVYTLTRVFSHRFKALIRAEVLRTFVRFSFADYVAGLLWGLPSLALPLIITNLVSPQASAYYYMDMMIINLLHIIPIATTQSLFAEGAYNQKELRRHLVRAALMITSLMIPASAALLAFGPVVLSVFGPDYALRGVPLLRVLTASSFFVAANLSGNAVLKIRGRVKTLMAVNLFNAVAVLGLTFNLLADNLDGVGQAWLIGQVATTIVFVPIIAVCTRDI